MTEKIKFEVTEIDSLLVSSCGHVMLIVEEVTTAVFSLSDALVLINEIPDQGKETVIECATRCN